MLFTFFSFLTIIEEMTPGSQDERPAAGARHLSYGKGPQGSCGVLFCFMAAKESLKDKAYHAILQGIFSSEYKPNQILNEKELIERYGYSKSPIREALIALCHDGVLRSIPRYGYEVVRLTKEDVESIMDYRLILETGFLKKGCQNLTEDQLQMLEEIDSLCNKPESDLLEHWKYNMDFHLSLLACAGNNFAYQELERAMNVLWRAYAQFYWNKWNNFVMPSDMRTHRKIIDALRRRDIDQAVAVLQEDFKDFGM